MTIPQEPLPQEPFVNMDWMVSLKDPEWVVGNVRFFIDRIPAKPATPIFRRILSELRHLDFETLQIEEGLTNWMILQQVTYLRPEFLDWLQNELFRYVRFSSSATTPQMLLGAEDMAFEELSTFELHEVLIRSLARNFFEQFSVYLSRRSGAG